MKLILYLMCFMYFTYNNSFSNEIINEPRWVTADVGLNLRDNPNINSKIIEVIPFGEMVILNDETGDKIIISGETGKWSKIEWHKKTGWVFGGFVSKNNPLLFDDIIFLDSEVKLCLKYKPKKIIYNGSTIENDYVYENNNLVKFIQKYDKSNNNRVSTYAFEYENGLIKKITEHNIIIYITFNDKNLIIEEKASFTSDGNLMGEHHYTYNEKYLLLEDYSFGYNVNQKPYDYKKRIYEYDDNNKIKIIHYIDLDDNKNNIDIELKKIYNSDHSFQINSSTNDSKSISKYNSKGLLIFSHWEKSPGGFLVETNLTYDEKNRLIKLDEIEKSDMQYFKINKEYIY